MSAVLPSHIPSVDSSSYPVRSGNALRALVDGEAAFGRICEAVEAAKKSVWVTIAFHKPDFVMPGGRGSLFDVLDKARARGIDVRTIFWRTEHVRNDAVADFSPSSIAMERKFRWLSTQRPAPFAWQTQDLHESGAVGDATDATAEKGEQLLDHGARSFCELLDDVDTFDLELFRRKPRQ